MKRKIHKFLNLSKGSILLILALMFTTGLMAQRNISGTVSDEGGVPLIGATVLVKGTANGTVTDIDGKFSISANTGDILEVSYTGYSAQDITVGAEDNIIVALAEGISIGEVVVTGYSVDSRRKTSGSVSTIKATALQVTPSGDIEQQLQGRVAGVTVVTNGQPGTTSQIRVRGFGALGGNAPLYIVDGVPVGSTNFLSPGDIETTTVLKDATAASIYGARAAGGVIVYTTKKGKKGKQKMQVTYDGMIGVTTPGTGPSILSPQEQAEWTWNAVRNAATQAGEAPDFNHPQYGTGSSPVLPDYLLVGSQSGVSGTVNLDAERANYNVDANAGPLYQVIKTNKAGTDWYDVITRNALLNRHNLGFSGGVENGRYYVGLGMQEQDGIVQHQGFSRYSFRVNSEFDLLPSLRIGENIQATYRSARLLFGSSGGSGSSDDENVMLLVSRMPAAIPVYDEFGGYAGTAAPGFNNPQNPLAQLDGAKNNRAFETQAFGNVYLEFEPMENLIFRTSFGGQYFSQNVKSYSRRTYENSENNSAFGFRQSANYGSSWVWTNTVNYKKDFGIHTVGILLGQEALNTGRFGFISGFGTDPFSTNPDFVSLSTASAQPAQSGFGNGVNFSSYFGRLTYDYDDKYIVSAILRRDGSSRFGSENRYGVFPAFSLAWRVTGERFMSAQTLFDDLKIRGGYGILGNSNNVNPSNQFSLFGTSIGRSSYDIGGTNSSANQGFYRTRIGNPNARWEKSITSTFGIDALMLNGKLDIGLDFWKRVTEDLLFQLPVTVQSGFHASAPSVNVGKMQNKGIDLKIGTKGKINDISVEVILNGGLLNNKIVELAENVEDLPDRSSGYRGITPVLNQIDQPISAFYGYQVEGLFANQGEVDGAATQEGAAPGRFRFKDINGTDENGEVIPGQPDGNIDFNDRTVIGSPVPDFTGGLHLKFKYKNFGLSLYSFASIGNDIYNMTKVFSHFYPLFPGAAINSAVKDSWTFENPTGDHPIFENVSNFSTNTQSNSFYVEDGSYFRLQNLSFSYNLPSTITDQWNIERLKVFASVNNLLTITGYSGLDPSVGGSADTNFGVDLGNFPITRSWTFGVSVGF